MSARVENHVPPPKEDHTQSRGSQTDCWPTHSLVKTAQKLVDLPACSPRSAPTSSRRCYFVVGRSFAVRRVALHRAQGAWDVDSPRVLVRGLAWGQLGRASACGRSWGLPAAAPSPEQGPSQISCGRGRAPLVQRPGTLNSGFLATDFGPLSGDPTTALASAVAVVTVSIFLKLGVGSRDGGCGALTADREQQKRCSHEPRAPAARLSFAVERGTGESPSPPR